jgi:hypothetical protein
MWNLSKQLGDKSKGENVFRYIRVIGLGDWVARRNTAGFERSGCGAGCGQWIPSQCSRVERGCVLHRASDRFRVSILDSFDTVPRKGVGQSAHGETCMEVVNVFQVEGLPLAALPVAGYKISTCVHFASPSLARGSWFFLESLT